MAAELWDDICLIRAYQISNHTEAMERHIACIFRGFQYLDANSSIDVRKRLVNYVPSFILFSILGQRNRQRLWTDRNVRWSFQEFHWRVCQKCFRKRWHPQAESCHVPLSTGRLPQWGVQEGFRFPWSTLRQSNLPCAEPPIRSGSSEAANTGTGQGTLQWSAATCW